jgi:hypothetical protein
VRELVGGVATRKTITTTTSPEKKSSIWIAEVEQRNITMAPKPMYEDEETEDDDDDLEEEPVVAAPTRKRGSKKAAKVRISLDDDNPNLSELYILTQ